MELVLDTSAVVLAIVDHVAEIDVHARWLAPQLIDLEFSNVLWKRVRFGGMTPSKAESLWEAFRELPIARTPDAELLGQAREFAYSSRCTVYDSLYAVLARYTGATLITADKALVRVAAEAGIVVARITV